MTVCQKRTTQDCPQEALDTTMGQQLQDALQRQKDEMQLQVDVLAQEKQEIRSKEAELERWQIQEKEKWEQGQKGQQEQWECEWQNMVN